MGEVMDALHILPWCMHQCLSPGNEENECPVEKYGLSVGFPTLQTCLSELTMPVFPIALFKSGAHANS